MAATFSGSSRPIPETRGIPIVVVTGADTRNLRTSDFSALLKKPVSTDSLLQTIDDALHVRAISASRWRTMDARTFIGGRSERCWSSTTISPSGYC